jgi:fructose-specific phosphotransferase system IIA component
MVLTKFSEINTGGYMRLTEILTEDQILIPLEADERNEAIKRLVRRLGQKGNIEDEAATISAVLEREKIMTTGVGNGIAIPHCKHASCPQFSVALGVQPAGISFEAIDQKKVKIIFLLTGPENNPGLHIKLLSRISRLMSNEELREKVIAGKNASEVLALIKEEENYFFDLD